MTSSITTHAWIGQPSPLYWFLYITTGREFCHEVDGPAGGGGYCWPMSDLHLSPTRPADVVDNNTRVPPGRRGTGNPVITDVAESSVKSVTAVLPDGRRYHGVVGTGGGFGGAKAWSVAAPAVKGTKLIFAGAAGQIITELSTAAPRGPAALYIPRPAHGGVTMFHYPSSGSLAGGTVSSYLVNGHVAFFSSGTTEALPFGGAFLDVIHRPGRAGTVDEATGFRRGDAVRADQRPITAGARTPMGSERRLLEPQRRTRSHGRSSG